ncbi:hypothetical protein KPN_02498 [Klebsiella pneumoniae subsp. pneumoniae MGH 78578]|uniref:Uncharacterized protein n=1 Tax=Klebsiella pneumoniae subsp. pneumoniae (strain ATCC 700721 / MGH 78578) TaxID=272620 RepID=A6TBE5_KLEP7|nr:hypothetical protein KPN_02498 [Klebsiella pneumoniae subsp. pneumoniae MGH 78578]
MLNTDFKLIVIKAQYIKFNTLALLRLLHQEIYSE